MVLLLIWKDNKTGCHRTEVNMIAKQFISICEIAEYITNLCHLRGPGVQFATADRAMERGKETSPVIPISMNVWKNAQCPGSCRHCSV